MNGDPAGPLIFALHRTLTRGLSAMAIEIRKRTGLNRVCLERGCFQNRLLLEGPSGRWEMPVSIFFTIVSSRQTTGEFPWDRPFARPAGYSQGIRHVLSVLSRSLQTRIFFKET